MVGAVLGARFPMLIWWGPKLIQIYNDAFRVILGDKHPASFAAAGPQVWSEIWDIVGPMADSILAGGPPTWSEHRLLPMNRTGFPRGDLLHVLVQPDPGDDGPVGGVLVTAHEATEQVEGNLQPWAILTPSPRRASTTPASKPSSRSSTCTTCSCRHPYSSPCCVDRGSSSSSPTRGRAAPGTARRMRSPAGRCSRCCPSRNASCSSRCCAASTRPE